MPRAAIKVLSVEDDPADVELLRRDLERIPDLEADLISVVDSCAALTELESGQIDVVFLDHFLGEETAVDVLDAVRSAGHLCPVIILTGSGDALTAATLIRMGADDYVTKDSMAPDVLLRAMDGAIAASNDRLATESTRTALIVEDDHGDAQLLASALARIPRMHVACRFAHDLNSAVEAVGSEQVDLVFLDYVLEAETGLQVLNALRLARYDGPIIVVSGRGDEYTAVNFMRAGADDYLVKTTLNPESLKRSIRSGDQAAKERLAKRALSEHESKLRAVFESMIDSVITINERGTVETLNRAAEEMFGYAAAEIVGQNIKRLMPSPYREAHDGYLAEYSRTGIRNILATSREVTARRKDGTTFPAQLSVSEAQADGRNVFTGVVRDVTEQKDAEESLRESEGSLRDLIDNAGVLIHSVTPEGRLVFANRKWRETLGYEQDELADLKMFDFVHPDHHRLCMEVFERLMNGQAADRLEAVFLTKDGRSVHVEGNASCRFEDGRPVMTRGIFLDVTARKGAEEALRQARDELEHRVDERTTELAQANEQLKAEAAERAKVFEELRRSQARLAEAHRIAHLGNWKHDLRTDETYWSDEIYRIFGVRPEEFDVTLEAFMDRVHPTDRTLVAEAIKGALERRETYNIDHRIVRGDGQVRTVHELGEPLFDETDKLVGMIGIVQDITERKVAEEAIRRQTKIVALHQAVAVAANEARDVESALQFALDRVCEHAGWPVGHVYRVADDDPSLLVPTANWHADDSQRFQTFREVTMRTNFERGIGLPGRVLASGKPAWIVDVIKDPNFPRAKLAKNIGVKGAFGFPVLIGAKVVAVMEFFSEKVEEPNEELLDVMAHVGAQIGPVIEREQAQRALQRERDGLERAVEERTLELRKSMERVEEANRDLEGANRHRSEFLSHMSHELRTPLNSVIGFSDLLRNDSFGALNDEQRDFVDHIRRSGDHLLSLINDLLDTAKIDAGAMELEIEPLLLGDCAESALGMLQTEFQEKNLSVDATIEPEKTVVFGDRRRVTQILLNLLSNAVKYTPRGGSVEIRAVRVDGAIQVSVSDTGVGIEADQLDEIFSEFHQADRKRDEAMGGTGIGLALTRRLVELHGGRITVRSRPGSGSAFAFTLPNRKKSEPIGGIGAEGALLPGRPVTRRRILVAEDNDVNLKMILAMLDIHEHDVTIARNGMEAVEFAGSKRPELIIMDIRMPEMSGIDAARKIKGISELAQVPIIACTASADLGVKEHCLQAGCDGFLAKPIQANDLFAALARFLD